ncbi:MAG: alpha/beta hydrolase [Niabella sp.]
MACKKLNFSFPLSGRRGVRGEALFTFFFSFFLFTLSLSAQQAIPVWPNGKKPNNNGFAVSDTIKEERIWTVANPTLYCFPATKEKNTGTAVLICPGGGYVRLPDMRQKYALANWFAENGINAYVLISRLPNQQDLIEPQIAALQDAQRAIKIIRANAKQWNLNPEKVGVMGTSAGGHVASLLSTREKDYSNIGDVLDTFSHRPNFQVLMSPVITMGAYAHKGSKISLLGADTANAEKVHLYSNETQVTKFTPPTFLIHAFNDRAVPVQNSLLFYNALVENNIVSSIHIFPQGGHAIGVANNPGSTEMWKPLLLAWLQEIGIYTPKQ